jgi:glycosyltransferase involved in cell wall biosynthesis
MSDVRHTKVIRIIARLNVGGPAKHVVWLTSGLQEAGFDTLLIAGKVPEGEEDMSYFADHMGVRPRYIPEMSREISLDDAVTIRKLYRLFLRERPDIVHTHTAKAGTVGRIAGFFYRWLTPGTLIGRPRRCKFVHTYHGHVFHSYYGRAQTRVFLAIERLLAKLVTDRIIVVSKQQGIEIGEKFRVGRRGQIKVIPLGLDLDIFSADHAQRRSRFRQEFCIPDDAILVGIVGRLTEIKNHEMFLNVVARLKAVDPACRRQGAVRFIVIGDGLLRETLERQKQSLGLDADVIFVGSRKDPEFFYPALDVVALTSLNEGTPLTLIEAMANSRPVVATSVGGVVDLLGDVVEDGPYRVCRRGISVPAGDEDAFVAALSRIIRDRSLQQELGRRGLEFVEVNYSKERLFEDIKSLYGELLNREGVVNRELRVADFTANSHSKLR